MPIYVTYKHTQPRTHNQMAKSLIAKLATLTSRFKIPHPLTIALSTKKKKPHNQMKMVLETKVDREQERRLVSSFLVQPRSNRWLNW